MEKVNANAPHFSYMISPRDQAVGGGWRLQLLEAGIEVGGGAFPVTEDVSEDQAYFDASGEGEDWLLSRALLRTAAVAQAGEEVACTCPSGTGSLHWPCPRHPAANTVQLHDAMIDIETLGTKPGCAILSIGAVMFGPDGLGETFYAPVLPQSCSDVGLTIDIGTVTWWMRQSDAARKAAFPDDAVPLPCALADFFDWFLTQKAKRPWCHGAMFDVPILDAAFKACGMAPPWEFWNVRDTRTLYDLAGVKIDRSNYTHHNALDDAKAQAEAAVKALSIIAGRSASPDLAQAEEATLYRKLTGVAMALGYQGLVDALADLGKIRVSASEGVAARDVLAERRRQVEQEGWTPARDDQYRGGELSMAAVCYANTLAAGGAAPHAWPWPEAWWKPSDERCNLVKAGALILAEIERLDRADRAAKEARECTSCDWKGTTDRMLGSIGPLCLACGDTTELSGTPNGGIA